MKVGITLKLFLAILAASAVAAGAMALATHLSFQSGFLGYLNQVEAQRLDVLSQRLGDEYRARGSWDFLRGDYRRLRELAFTEQPPGPRMALLDAGRATVAGNPELPEGSAMRPVRVNDKVVGWVGISPFRRLTSAAEVSFQQEQQRSAWIIAALSLALAAAIAVILARAFLLPVKRLAAATHDLAAGAYDTRVALSGRDELGALAADFNSLAETLERNETLRRRFMADVSHELRTPIAVLSAELEALQDGVRPLTQASVASLRAEVAGLSKLVDDLNQLALTDAGALAYRKENVALGPILEQAVQSWRERFLEKDLTVELACEENLQVFGDAGRLGQMFRNLLENSLRYTDAGGSVRLSARRIDGSVQVELDDSAPGVPQEALPRLFERFYRVEASRSRANGGSGLGLSICRSIAAAHDGGLAAAASPLGGLRVTVKLPAA